MRAKWGVVSSCLLGRRSCRRAKEALIWGGCLPDAGHPNTRSGMSLENPAFPDAELFRVSGACEAATVADRHLAYFICLTGQPVAAPAAAVPPC